MTRKFAWLLLKVGLLAGSIAPLPAFQTETTRSPGEVQTVDLVSNPEPQALANTKKSFRQGDIVRILDGNPVDLQRLMGVGGGRLVKRAATPSSLLTLEPVYRIVAARSTRSGALHEYIQTGGKSADTTAYQAWAAKEAQLAAAEANGNAVSNGLPSAPPEAWTELQQTTLNSADADNNILQNTISIYRLNDIDLTSDWYMVLTDPVSQPRYAGCAYFGTGPCGWWTSKRVFTMSTVPQAVLYERGPTNKISTTTESFSLGFSLTTSAAGASTGFSESWQQPSVTTTDQSDVTSGTGMWTEAFQGQGAFGKAPPETSIGSFESYQGSIFQVPEGTLSFQFNLDAPITSQFQPTFGDPYTDTQDQGFQVNVFPPVFAVSATDLFIPPVKGSHGKGYFEITAVNPTTSNTGVGLPWEVTYDPKPWFNVVQKTGSGSATVEVDVDDTAPVGSVVSINVNTNPPYAAPSVEVKPFVVNVHVGQANDTGILLTGGFTDAQNDAQNLADLFSPQLGAFDFETSMKTPRGLQTATLLLSGQLLVTGGLSAPQIVTSSAELFDPGTAAFTATTGLMSNERVYHTASPLVNGSVLVAGGIDSNGFSGGPALATADVYDPASQLFKPVGPMTVARFSHTSTLLQNGTVLIIGGLPNVLSSTPSDTAETFDPVSGKFTSTAGNLVSGVVLHTATLLKDGRVLIAGGLNNNGVTNAAQLYNPAARSFTSVSSLNVARSDHTASLLPDGTVLIAGGVDGSGNALAAAEIYNPETQAFTLLSGSASCPGNAGCMISARAFHTATRELSGMVFLAGGLNPANQTVLGSTEIYNPATKTFTAGPDSTPRTQHTATLLQRPTTTVTLASSLNPSASGQKITLTAIAKIGDGGAPTGTVTFLDGTTALGTASLEASSGESQATASFSTNSLLPGPHSLTAAYSGDLRHGKSTSSILVQTVSALATTTTLRSSDNPSMDGEPVTFTATVSAAGGSTPAGLVTFRNSGTTLGISSLTGTTASFTTSTLGNGSNAITATYSGDADFATSTSAVLTQNVTKIVPTISFSVNPNPAGFGQDVLLSAVVKSSDSAPTGNVTFMDGSKNLQTVPLVSGLAPIKLSNLSIGSHSLTASYNGDLTHAAVTSTAVVEQINTTSVTVVLTSSLDPSFYGQNVVFTATVMASDSNVPTGTVTFLDALTPLGTVPLSSGVATLPTSALTGGAHTIRAAYNGDTGYAKNVSAPLTQTVQAVPSTTTVTSSVNPSNAGQTVIFTATVTGSAPTPPAGVVIFYDGQNVLGTPGLSGGIAAIPISTLSAGAHNITAAYSGTKNFAASTSSILVQNVAGGKTATSTSLSSSANPSKPGQSVQFTAIVSSANGTPTGTVRFSDGQTSLGSGTLTGGQTTFSTTGLSVGAHSIVAIYAGDATHTGSSSTPLVETVAGLVTPTITLTVQPNTAGAGVPVTFTATVSYPGGPVPTGSVNISEGSTSYGSAPLVNGVGKVVTSTIPVGSHSVTATYGGDGGSFYNGAQSTSVSVTIQQ